MNLPLDKQGALNCAIKGLQAEGATEVHVFGSSLDDRFREDSDLDLAVRGIPAERWYFALGKALEGLPVSADVIDLDRPSRFVEFLIRSGRLRRVA